MKREWITGIVFGLAVSIILSLFAPLAQAGPQLICWPFDIGAARSLPWGGSGWHDAQADYDVSHLAADTLALLTPDALVLTRMETLRRAAIYAERDSRAAQELLSKLQARADAAQSDALAIFDLGYFAEAYRQTGMMRSERRRRLASGEESDEPRPPVPDPRGHAGRIPLPVGGREDQLICGAPLSVVSAGVAPEK